MTTATNEGRQEHGDLDPDGVGFLLGVAHRVRRRQWEAHLADLGLTAPQAAVLRLVAAEPGSGVRLIARRLGTDAMNAQRIADTLVARGLCDTRADPQDARRRPLHPTPQGRDLATRVAERAGGDERHLADALGTRTYRALTAALRTVIELDTRTG